MVDGLESPRLKIEQTNYALLNLLSNEKSSIHGGYYLRGTFNATGQQIDEELVSEKGEESGYTCCEATDERYECEVSNN